MHPTTATAPEGVPGQDPHAGHSGTPTQGTLGAPFWAGGRFPLLLGGRLLEPPTVGGFRCTCPADPGDCPQPSPWDGWLWPDEHWPLCPGVQARSPRPRPPRPRSLHPDSGEAPTQTRWRSRGSLSVGQLGFFLDSSLPGCGGGSPVVKRTVPGPRPRWAPAVGSGHPPPRLPRSHPPPAGTEVGLGPFH